MLNRLFFLVSLLLLISTSGCGNVPVTVAPGICGFDSDNRVVGATIFGCSCTDSQTGQPLELCNIWKDKPCPGFSNNYTPPLDLFGDEACLDAMQMACSQFASSEPRCKRE